MFLLFKFPGHETKQFFCFRSQLSSLVGTFIAIGDITDTFAIVAGLIKLKIIEIAINYE